MFASFFGMIREGIKSAILGGFEDAKKEIERRAEECRTPQIESIPASRLNGSSKPKLKS